MSLDETVWPAWKREFEAHLARNQRDEMQVGQMQVGCIISLVPQCIRGALLDLAELVNEEDPDALPEPGWRQRDAIEKGYSTRAEDRALALSTVPALSEKLGRSERERESGNTAAGVRDGGGCLLANMALTWPVCDSRRNEKRDLRLFREEML